TLWDLLDVRREIIQRGNGVRRPSAFQLPLLHSAVELPQVVPAMSCFGSAVMRSIPAPRHSDDEDEADVSNGFHKLMHRLLRQRVPFDAARRPFPNRPELILSIAWAGPSLEPE